MITQAKFARPSDGAAHEALKPRQIIIALVAATLLVARLRATSRARYKTAVSGLEQWCAKEFKRRAPDLAGEDFSLLTNCTLLWHGELAILAPTLSSAYRLDCLDVPMSTPPETARCTICQLNQGDR